MKKEILTRIYKIDRWMAFRNRVKQLGIDEITKYCISSAKLILRIFEAYLVKKTCPEVFSFKDKFALAVANMELFEEGKACSVRQSFRELHLFAKASYEDRFVNLIVSVIFNLERVIIPCIDYLISVKEKTPFDNAAYFYVSTDLEYFAYFAYLYELSLLCKNWNKLKQVSKESNLL
jgi:hypothetical protein